MRSFSLYISRICCRGWSIAHGRLRCRVPSLDDCEKGDGVLCRIFEDEVVEIADVVKANADKHAAMNRLRNISAPVLHIGREGDHLQGIFRLAHEWMLEAGLAVEWKSFTHADHGFCLIYGDPSREFLPDSVQRKAFESYMSHFDRFLKNG